MHRRADVVAETRKRQFGRSASAPRFVGRLEDIDHEPRSGERQCGDQSVGSRPDDDGIGVPHCLIA